MIIWVHRQNGDLLTISDMRELCVVSVYRDGGVPNQRVVSHYEVVVRFGEVPGPLSSQTLAKYSTVEQAAAYHRFMGMTASRAGEQRKAFCIIPSVNEESAERMSKRFAILDEEENARRARNRERENPSLDDDAAFETSI